MARSSAEDQFKERISALNEAAPLDMLMQGLGVNLPYESKKQSMLDAVTLGLTDDSAIRNFFRTHGINVNDPNDFAYVKRIFTDAILFLDQNFTNGDDGVHANLASIKKQEDVYRIFKVAAGQDRKQLITQACAILRIVMAINFMEQDPIIALIPVAEQKLKDITGKHFVRNGKDFSYRTGKTGDLPMPLIRFEMRVKKRDRIIMKLLHKPTNYAQEVVDHIGCRITTKSAMDTLNLLYSMFFHPKDRIFPAENIRIGKTENRLLQPERIVELLNNPQKAKRFVERLLDETIDHADFNAVTPENQHTAPAYRALHVTFDLPLVVDERRCLFPVEFQFVDLESYTLNKKVASHEDYVKRQRDAVHDRLMKNNLLTVIEARKT